VGKLGEELRRFLLWTRQRSESCILFMSMSNTRRRGCGYNSGISEGINIITIFIILHT
jgi:hypothetical protein